MFRCNNCGHIFNKPKSEKWATGEYHGHTAYETWSVCPECRSEDYDEYEEEDEEEEDED